MQKNIISFYLYRIFSRLYFHVPMLFVYFYMCGISVIEIELLLALYGLVLVFAPRLVINFKNKYKQKNIIITGELIKAFGLLCFILSQNIFVLILGQLLSGFGYSLTAGTDSNLLKKLFVTYDETRYNNKTVEANSNSYMFISFLGAGILGSVIFQVDHQLVFILSILSNILAIISISLVAENQTVHTIKAINNDINNNVKERKINKATKDFDILFWKRYYAISRAVTLASFVGFLPYYFFMVVHVNLYYFSAILSLFNLFGFFSSRYVMKLEKKLGYKILTIYSSIILVIAFLIFGFSNNIIISIIDISLLGIASGGIRPITISNLNKMDLDQNQRTKVFSSMEQIYGFCNALLLIVGGVILNFYGFKKLMIAIAITYLFLMLFNILKHIRGGMKMQITYLGHSCLLVRSGSYKVIIDPFISGNPETKVNPVDIKVNAVIITHGHMDHVGDALEIAKNNNCIIVVIDELGKHIAKKDSSLKIHGLGVGGAYQFDWGKVKLTTAIHSIGVELTEEFEYSMPVGILLTMGEKILYHAGDTGVFSDMKLIGELNKIDMAALPIGGNYTMDIPDSVVAAKMLHAKKYMPIHYNTFHIIKQDDMEWSNAMKLSGLDGVILKNGDSINI